MDGTGRKIEYTEKAKEDTYRTACEVLEKAMAGDDFDELIRHYNVDAESLVPAKPGRQYDLHAVRNAAAASGQHG